MDGLDKILKNIDIDAIVKGLLEEKQKQVDCVARNHCGPDGMSYTWTKLPQFSFFSYKESCDHCLAQRTRMVPEEERRRIMRNFDEPMMYRA